VTTLSADTVISAAIATAHPATKNGALQTAPAIALQRLPFFQQRSVFSLAFFDSSIAAKMHLPCGLRVYELIFQEKSWEQNCIQTVSNTFDTKKNISIFVEKSFFSKKGYIYSPQINNGAASTAPTVPTGRRITARTAHKQPLPFFPFRKSFPAYFPIVSGNSMHSRDVDLSCCGARYARSQLRL